MRPFGKSSAAPKRPRKGHIKHGVEGLDDLDAPEVKLQRTEEGSQVAVVAEGTSRTEAATAVRGVVECGGSTSIPVRTVEDLLGSWNEWRSLKKYLFPLNGHNPTAQGIRAAESIIKQWHQKAFHAKPDIRALISKGKKREGKTSFVGGCSLPGYVEASYLLVSSQTLDREYIATSKAKEGKVSTPQLSPRGLAPLDLGSGANAPNANCTIVQHDMVVNQYCLAISRAVHLMTAGQAQGVVEEGVLAPSTYREKAASIEMPEEAVEVRNEVAHGHSLPSLTLLRWTCGLLLDWLFEKYWVLQERHIKTLKDEKAVGSKSGGSQDAIHEVDREATIRQLLKSKAAASPPSTAPLSLAELKAKLASRTKEEPTATQKGPRDDTPLPAAENSGWKPLTDGCPWLVKQ